MTSPPRAACDHQFCLEGENGCEWIAGSGVSAARFAPCSTLQRRCTLEGLDSAGLTLLRGDLHGVVRQRGGS